MKPCRIKKSIITGHDVVLNSGEKTRSKHSAAGKSSNPCTFNNK